MSNKPFIKIPPCVLFYAGIKLDELGKILEPYLVVLTPPERQDLIKIETETIEFLKLSHVYAVENPWLFPVFIKEAIFRKDLFAAHGLWLFINRIDQLKDNIIDTETLTGNHALETALAFYRIVKIAARRDIPGAKVVFEDLKPASRFRKRKKQKKAAENDERQLELFESRDFFSRSKKL